MNKNKIAILAICLNAPYWPYLGKMIESARKFLLKGHDVEFLTFTDMPVETNLGPGVTIFPTEPFQWPLPTLMRYNLFLQQEEKLKEYDFLYYVDADMKFVSRVGDEIFGDLVMAKHPMYDLARMYIPPYEPNPKSASYIPRPGRVIEENGKKRFEPLYAAGGFQGGRTDVFIKAMKAMKENIDKNFVKNYVDIWNDETAWNFYLFKHPPTVVLSPSYVYPDSLNKGYYQKVWGRNYVPKIVTITKPFTLTREGGEHLKNILPAI